MRGDIICLKENCCPVCFEFEAKISVLELPENKSIISKGYKAIIHMHTAVEEIEIKDILAVCDQEKQTKSHNLILKSGYSGIVRLQVAKLIFKHFKERIF